MAKIQDNVKDFIKNRLAYVATVDSNGRPNVAPKGYVYGDTADKEI